MHKRIEDIHAFMKLGYFLDYQSTISIEPKKWERRDVSTQIAKNLFLSAIEKQFENESNNLLPLSGGLDSRLMLGALLEFTSAENLDTYTFGIPGSFDYEIGNYIAKEVGTRHTKIDLGDYTYTLPELMDISSRIDHQTMLFHHPNVWLLDDQFKDYKVWSGFLGDFISGSHLMTTSRNRKQVMELFTKENSYVKSIDLSHNSNKIIYSQLDIANFEHSNLTLYEKMDFQNRQLKYIAPHVLIKGFEYCLPFLDSNFFHYFCSLPTSQRRNSIHYLKFLSDEYSELFRLPTKQNVGLPLKASKLQYYRKKAFLRINKEFSRIFNRPYMNPYVNYMDFEHALRNRPDLKKIVIDNVNDLKLRGIIDWFDLDTLVKNHFARNQNFADALIILASLEIHLKSGLKLS